MGTWETVEGIPVLVMRFDAAGARSFAEELAREMNEAADESELDAQGGGVIVRFTAGDNLLPAYTVETAD